MYVLYDEIGSYNLPRAYRRELAEAGVVILPFRTSQGSAQSVPDQFSQPPQDRDRRRPRGVRRRTERGRRVSGAASEVRPVARYARRSAAGRWCRRFSSRFWRTGIGRPATCRSWIGRPTPLRRTTRRRWCWRPDPSDLLETCGLFFMHAINSARQRLWIASPYFVPDAVADLRAAAGGVARRRRARDAAGEAGPHAGVPVGVFVHRRGRAGLA